MVRLPPILDPILVPIIEYLETTVGRIVGGSALLVAGGIVTWRAFERELELAAAAGVLAAAGGLYLLDKLLMAAATRRPGVWVGAGLASAASGIVLAFALELAWALGVSLVGVGYALYRAGTRHVCAASENARRRCTLWGLVLSVVGITLVLLGVHGEALVVAALGAFFTGLGLTPVTIGWLKSNVRPLGAKWTIGIGALVLLLGLASWPPGRPDYLWWAAGLILGGIGFSFSWRWEGFAFAALAVLAVFWVLRDRTDDATPPDPNPSAEDRILALGDSYISGEGSHVFFPGTNVVGEDQNQCRRSPTAFPYLVAENINMGLDFFACSGAKAGELHETGQMGEESPDDVPGEKPQLDYVPADTSHYRLVLVSIGGNDALFGEIGIACVLPGSCNDLREHWLVNVSRIGPSITRAYEAIKQRIGEEIPIVAMPYPMLLNQDGCGWSALNPSEHDFLVEFITVLNDRVRKSAREAGINFFAGGMFAFEGSRICDGGPDDTVMNFFNAVPTQGGFLARVNPTNWVHGTFHPKPSGHQAIADKLEPWLEDLLGRIDAGDSANPEPKPEASFRIRQVSSIETVLVNTEDLPTNLRCPVERVSAFGTLLPLMDAEDTFALNASEDEPVCFTRPDGGWTAIPGDVISREDEVTRVQPQLPVEGSRQKFIYEDADEGTWQIQIVEFCVLKEDCPNDVGIWMQEELTEGAKRAVLAAVLIFVGGWFLGLGLRRAWLSRRQPV